MHVPDEILLTGLTPMMIAQRYKHAELIQWLARPAASPADFAPKRERSAMTILERAQLAGVSHKLKPTPDSLHTRIATGTTDDAVAAKKELHALQKLNS